MKTTAMNEDIAITLLLSFDLGLYRARVLSSYWLTYPPLYQPRPGTYGLAGIVRQPADRSISAYNTSITPIEIMI